MIVYNGGFFGLNLLFRLHGSAIFKSLTPALLSSVIFMILYRYTDLHLDPILAHPYPMAALVTAFSFLLVFNANFAYNRYWEAFTAVHLMHSKWLDLATEVAAFHYQSTRYDAMKPPAFGAHPNAKVVTRERERNDEMNMEELEEHIQKLEAESNRSRSSLTSSLKSRFRIFMNKKNKKHDTTKDITNQDSNNKDSSSNKEDSSESYNNTEPDPSNMTSMIDSSKAVKFQSEEMFRRNIDLVVGSPSPKTTVGPNTNNVKSINKVVVKSKHDKRNARRRSTNILLDENGKPFSSFKQAARRRLKKGHLDPNLPPLFLEEIAHLLSLMSAVAMSTLRNDMEEAESPLGEFRPGAPWPHVDPDDFAADIRTGWDRKRNTLSTIASFVCGMSRNERSRTLYNAARPFRVIGNVSDAEIELLQVARGPQAKLALCSLWLQEFLTREYMSGSTGKVAPPIISRLYQFISDGMAGYNQARKIAYIPFPFPHAQITTLFVLIICGFIPVLMLTYLESAAFGFILNVCTVMCFTGLHEVARELENPFKNVPNDIPLNNFQAQFNEGLMIMFFGYHPDAYWKEEDNDNDDAIDKKKLPEPEPTSSKSNGNTATTEKPQLESSSASADEVVRSGGYLNGEFSA